MMPGISRWRVLAITTTVFGLLAGACSDAAAPVTTTEVPATTQGRATTEAPTDITVSVPTTSAPFVIPDPNPARAEVTLETGASVAAVIGPDGGSITAVGSDGRTYVLTVPAGYVTTDMEITMTPIADLSSPILDEFSAGVQLGPEGLVFPGIAWLDVSGTDVPEPVVAVTYRGDGEDAAIGWVDVAGDHIRIPVTHFSGVGAGTPAPGAGGRVPSDPVTAMASVLTDAWLESGGECIGRSDDIGKGLAEWYQTLFETDVEPKLKAATSDDMVLSEAVRAALYWRAARQHLAGLLCEDLATDLDEVPADDRLDELATAGLENAIDTAADSCATSHDLGETRYMLGWMASAQLLFGDEDGDWSRLADERVTGCLTFELEFNSYVEVTNPGWLIFTGQMKSTIEGLMPLAQSLSLGLSAIDGDDGTRAGPLSYTPTIDLSYDEGCPVLITQVEAHPTLALLPEVTIPAPTRQVPIGINRESTKPPDEFRLIFYPLDGSEFFDASCTDLLGGPNPDGAWGPFTFNGLHEDEMNPVYEGFNITLERGTGKLYGRATYQRERSEEGATIYEETTFDLFHAAPRVP